MFQQPHWVTDGRSAGVVERGVVGVEQPVEAPYGRAGVAEVAGQRDALVDAPSSVSAPRRDRGRRGRRCRPATRRQHARHLLAGLRNE